jgi:hypothetical protein
MAQVLENLGTLVTKDTGRSKEHEAPNSSSNPALDVPDMEILSPKEIKHLEPHIEVNSHIEQTEHTK